VVLHELIFLPTDLTAGISKHGQLAEMDLWRKFNAARNNVQMMMMMMMMMIRSFIVPISHTAKKKRSTK